MTPDRVERWPQDFPIPTFSYEIELVLGEGDVAYERKGKALKLFREQKHDILEILACIVSMHTPVIGMYQW